MKFYNKLHLIRLMFFFGLLFCFIIAGKSFADHAQTLTDTPEKIVAQFCRLDAEGNRLSGETLNKIRPLVTWTEEAGDMFSVIFDYKLGQPSVVDYRAEVPVTYKMLGSTDTIQFSEASKKTVVITFKLIKQNGSWKIQEPITAPHVYWKVAIKHILKIKKSEPAREKSLDLIIQKIKKAAEK